MKILYITQCDPCLTGSGTEQRTHRLWLKLREMGVVDVVEWGCFRKRCILAAIFRRLFRPAELPRFLSLGKDEKYRYSGYDLVVTRYLNTAVRAKAWECTPCKVDIDDLPSEACRTVWSRSWPVGFRWVPIYVVSAWEKWALKKCAGAWVANRCDVGMVSRFCPCEVFENDALPPSVGYQASGRQERILMTVGRIDYPPNFYGICRFLRKVWPEIRRRHPAWEYHVAGEGGELLPADVRTPGVKMLGFVQDIDALYETAAGVVAPIFTGAGTSIKVREALSRKRTVFTTSFAARGLPTSENLVLCETDDAMVSSIDDWINECETGLLK